MILEGLVTTLNDDGSPHLAPMGPTVDRHIEQVTLRPFKTSQTFRNLKRTRCGVLHVSDDVELIARAAVGALESLPRMRAASVIPGWILIDACRWYALQVRETDERSERAEFHCEVVGFGRQRDFFGFNRAKHAVLEAAILATRLELIPREEVLAEYARLAIPVEKTAGDEERAAFAFLQDYVQQWQPIQLRDTDAAP